MVTPRRTPPAAPAPPVSSSNNVAVTSLEQRLGNLQSALEGVAELCKALDQHVPSEDFVFTMGALASVFAAEAGSCSDDLAGLHQGGAL